MHWKKINEMKTKGCSKYQMKGLEDSSESMLSMLYGLETVAQTKWQKTEMEVAELKTRFGDPWKGNSQKKKKRKTSHSNLVKLSDLWPHPNPLRLYHECQLEIFTIREWAAFLLSPPELETITKLNSCSSRCSLQNDFQTRVQLKF